MVRPLSLRRLLKIKAMFVIPLVMPNEGTEDKQAAFHGEDGHAIGGTASLRRTHITSTIKSDVRGLVVIKQTKAVGRSNCLALKLSNKGRRVN